ncbi:MAG TPA: hypothetical protein PKC72_03185 [Chitinophagaceae bacterium]|nr:hypothetical protein [Chitinophagaceae bacterium]
MGHISSTMKQSLTVLFTFFLYAVKAQQQNPEVLLNQLSQSSPIEKVYLQLDREKYVAGETVWFSGYLYSDYQPDTISTVLFVELITEKSVVVNKKVLPVFWGYTNGQIEIPDSMQSGSYFIRAVTSTMLNNSYDFVFLKKVSVYGKNKSKEDISENSNHIRLDFFPEGGNLITGLTNTVAFKATYQNGMPASVKGKIKSGKGELVTEFATYHDGMGIFEIIPSAGEKYSAELDDNNYKDVYDLPLQTDKGIAVSITPHLQGNFFEIKQSSNDPDFRAAYMIGQMQNHVVFRQNFKNTKGVVQGIINTQNLMSGILQITFFNDKGIPLAERLCFVNNKEFIQQAGIVSDSIDFSIKGRNKISISLKDSAQGNLSVSVTDAEYDDPKPIENNIISHFFLASDIKGYIHDPAYYFSADTDSVNMALDLVMMTNGWRRFKWTDLLSGKNLNKGIKDPSYITLTGRAMIKDTKKPFASKQLFVWITGEDSSHSTHMIPTDEQGRYKLDSVVFFGKTRILFSDTRGKKSQYIDIYPDSNALAHDYILPSIDLKKISHSPLTGLSAEKKWEEDYEEIQKANGLMLGMVTVKTKKKDPTKELEEKYTSGLFGGFSEKTLDLVNAKDIITQQNIFDYLTMQIPSIWVSREDGSYSIYYRQAPTPSSMGSIPMTLFLDEVETDANVIASIPTNEIALVKLYNTFVGAAGNAPGGALAIYTKKGSDVSYNSRADVINYKGFSIIKEFYAPDYSVEKNKLMTSDNRITLDWRPSVFFNGINTRLPIVFYNNDRTKKFRVVVEGMTISGKLIYCEKIISLNQKGF